MTPATCCQHQRDLKAAAYQHWHRAVCDSNHNNIDRTSARLEKKIQTKHIEPVIHNSYFKSIPKSKFDMGGSIASHSDPFFEPHSLSKAQLQGVLQSFSEVVAEIAKYYKKLGEAYHELPLRVRFHALVPKHWRDYCVDAFISSDTRELPDMIQLINMLKEAFARARAAILCEEYGLAISRLRIAAHLIIEAEDRAGKLTYAVERYEALEEELKNLTGAEAYAMLCRQAVMLEGRDIPRALSKVVWRQSLPQSLQEVEGAAPGCDSGYNSGGSSVVPESQ